MRKRSLGSAACASAPPGAASSTEPEVVGEGSAPRYPWVPAARDPSSQGHAARCHRKMLFEIKTLDAVQRAPACPPRWRVRATQGPLVNGVKRIWLTRRCPRQ